jgi:hypothetical protein
VPSRWLHPYVPAAGCPDKLDLPLCAVTFIDNRNKGQFLLGIAHNGIAEHVHNERLA